MIKVKAKVKRHTVRVRINPGHLLHYPPPGYATCPRCGYTKRLRGNRPSEEFMCDKCKEYMVDRESKAYMPGDVVEVAREHLRGLLEPDPNMKGPNRRRFGIATLLKRKKTKKGRNGKKGDGR